MDLISSIPVAIAALSVAVAAISVVLGVFAWRREFIGKRRIELTESVLARFYEAADVIRAIRSPLSREDEGSSRKRSEGETAQETRMLDQAYVVFERYQSRQSLFAQIRSAKYQFMAAFGEEAEVPFDELASAVGKILIAARMLGLYRLRQEDMSQDARKKHIQKLEAQEAIIWDTGEEDDEIGPLVQAAVDKIQVLAQRAVAGRGFPE